MQQNPLQFARRVGVFTGEGRWLFDAHREQAAALFQDRAASIRSKGIEGSVKQLVMTANYRTQTPDAVRRVPFIRNRVIARSKQTSNVARSEARTILFPASFVALEVDNQKHLSIREVA